MNSEDLNVCLNDELNEWGEKEEVNLTHEIYDSETSDLQATEIEFENKLIKYSSKRYSFKNVIFSIFKNSVKILN